MPGRLTAGPSTPVGDRFSTRCSAASIFPASALDRSREVLADFGNMSSSTLMFVLAAILRQPDERERRGIALAFGPGLAAEGFRFERAA